MSEFTKEEIEAAAQKLGGSDIRYLEAFNEESPSILPTIAVYTQAALTRAEAALARKDEELREADRTKHALLAALLLLYGKYENGDPVFEDPETLDGALGNAVRLFGEEEDLILSALEMGGIETALSSSKRLSRNAKEGA